MHLTELEQRAKKELVNELQRRLELEIKNLDSARFVMAKLQIRVKLFGEESLDDNDREAYTRTYPDDIEKHEAEITHLQAQLEKLLAYGED